MARQIKNIAASVRARLFRVSTEIDENFDQVLVRYTIERLLYRLGQSRYADRFVLKGAILLMTWFEEPIRGTKDLDLLSYEDCTPDTILEIFKNIMSTDDRDGVVFDIDAINASPIKARDKFNGLRLRTFAYIDGARVTVKIDIGFGDATEPGIETVNYPVLLDMPAPQLRGYARETVVAEKFHAITTNGMSNSRMKDYYDIWILKRSFDFDRLRLASAIAATFTAQDSEIPSSIPDALTSDYADLPRNQRLWTSFKTQVTIDPGSLQYVISAIESFLMQAAEDARKKVQQE